MEREGGKKEKRKKKDFVLLRKVRKRIPLDHNAFLIFIHRLSLVLFGCRQFRPETETASRRWPVFVKKTPLSQSHASSSSAWSGAVSPISFSQRAARPCIMVLNAFNFLWGVHSANVAYLTNASSHMSGSVFPSRKGGLSVWLAIAELPTVTKKSYLLRNLEGNTKIRKCIQKVRFWRHTEPNVTAIHFRRKSKHPTFILA